MGLIHSIYMSLIFYPFSQSDVFWLGIQVYLVAQAARNLLAMWETWVQSLHWEDPPEEDMATHSSIQSWSLLDSIYISLFLSIQPVCLLVGVFIPFMFKVVIDMYIPIVIFVIIFGLLLCVSHDFFFFLFFACKFL